MTPGVDSNDLRISLVGELIYSASRISYKKNNQGELISLIEHLDSPIMKDFKIWEIYFLYRVCKSGVSSVTSKHHYLCIPDSDQDALDSNDKTIRLADPEFRIVVRLVKEGEPFHNVALTEIAYYLMILENMSQNSTEILLKLFVKYSLEKSLIESILEIHKSCSASVIKGKIDVILKRKKLVKPDENCLEKTLELSLEFLEKQDKLKLSLLSKFIHQKLHTKVLSSYLHQGADMKQRVEIYRRLIPERFKVPSINTSDIILFRKKTVN